MKKRLLVTISVLVIAAAAYLVYARQNGVLPSGVPKGYVQEKSYKYLSPGQPSCTAALPGCGYCPGITVDEKCYIKK